MEINKCDEKEAIKELKRIAEDNQITGQDVDWTDMGGNEDGDSREEDGEVGDEPSDKPTGGGDN